MGDAEQIPVDTKQTPVGLRIGLVVNPVAGIGGAVGLQGSDGVLVQEEARRRSGSPAGQDRLQGFLASLQGILGSTIQDIEWLAWGGEMGFQALAAMNVSARQLGKPQQPSTSADTKAAIKALCAESIDLLLFVGGDGTA